MTKIAITRILPDVALRALAAVGVVVEPRSPDRSLTARELADHVRGADAVVCLLNDRIDAGLLESAGPQLRVVANVAVGYNNVDVAAARERGIVVTNTPGVLTEATADLCLALILMVTRRLGEGERLIRAGTPWHWDLGFLLGSGIQDKTLGIVGLGDIGAAVARRARAFGMRVIYSAPRRARADVVAALDAEHVALDELFGQSDLVSLHCPLNDETYHLVDSRRLALMKPSAFIINTARGPVVDERALVEALTGGLIAGAGLDVFEHEPAVADGLLGLENVVVLPHLGSATAETRSAMAELAAANVVAVLRDEAPLTPVSI